MRIRTVSVKKQSEWLRKLQDNNNVKKVVEKVMNEIKKEDDIIWNDYLDDMHNDIERTFEGWKNYCEVILEYSIEMIEDEKEIYYNIEQEFNKR